MAMALSFNPSTPKLRQSTTCSVTGGSASTAYVASVATPQGHAQTVTFKTDGSGNASFPLVAASAGTFTVSVTPATASPVATASFNTGGS